MTQRIAVVDPGSGNLASVLRALDRAAADAGIPIAAAVTRDAAAVAAADRIVLPGQGAFAACMRGLAALPDMIGTLEARIAAGTPLLGICVGMQIMAERGLEHGATPGLGWIGGEIAPMAPRGPDGAPLPLPQMGWNTLDPAAGGHALLTGIRPGDHAYFVHSYALTGYKPAEVLATTDYGGPVVAIVGRGNIAGTQFHVEKSAAVGLRILANFLRWAP
ncbi:imidazole glycerol phosphate synthase subunit HisH [Paracraurococcus ruber]|uniref:Imidazole glycerol phosphate synthase subunit HisH n=1 Tax=Paracraurococcus ruber TaxID=77675 RepID=A0ABS1CZ19_9PROT|nr:imidazole glycerol phosphate synthase subunit HisH [Paracraurococcus ruber]MBK1659783.1 imidazole glycerol phosphate synthase subunit HisH [Paracraurococcus ruber]TDG32757.1 imidazole glycerol phosphate synthase subunit HisH [Paracraurococcus ruber]